MDLHDGYGGASAKFTFDHNYAYDTHEEGEADGHMDIKAILLKNITFYTLKLKLNLFIEYYESAKFLKFKFDFCNKLRIGILKNSVLCSILDS
uniref:CSON011369 protein n=1 Tax=Culicoides sonorensis TaxID=179676 RepID=A0A336M5W7_CULSO